MKQFTKYHPIAECDPPTRLDVLIQRLTEIREKHGDGTVYLQNEKVDELFIDREYMLCVVVEE